MSHYFKVSCHFSNFINYPANALGFLFLRYVAFISPNKTIDITIATMRVSLYTDLFL